VTAGGDPRDRLTEGKRRAIESIFEGLPQTINERYTVLQDIRKAFYAELARQFEPALNQYARAQPQVTDKDWSNLATSVNRMVRHLGLSLVSPRNNAPAALVFDTKRRGDRVTRRYRFHTIGRRLPADTCYELPHLELCQAPARTEALSREFKRTGLDSGPEL